MSEIEMKEAELRYLNSLVPKEMPNNENRYLIPRVICETH